MSPPSTPRKPESPSKGGLSPYVGKIGRKITYKGYHWVVTKHGDYGRQWKNIGKEKNNVQYWKGKTDDTGTRVIVKVPKEVLPIYRLTFRPVLEIYKRGKFKSSRQLEDRDLTVARLIEKIEGIYLATLQLSSEPIRDFIVRKGFLRGEHIDYVIEVSSQLPMLVARPKGTSVNSFFAEYYRSGGLWEEKPIYVPNEGELNVNYLHVEEINSLVNSPSSPSIISEVEHDISPK